MVVGTRERILQASAELFRRRGMEGTGLKLIAQAAQAPFGSIYHHFPGGKDELTEAVIRGAGADYRDFVVGILGRTAEPIGGVTDSFAFAADVLEAGDYTNACPIETIALEVASTNENLRVATADVFEDWIEAITGWLERVTDLSTDSAREIAIAYITALEGAFVLSRSMRSKEPLLAAGKAVAMALQAALTNGQ